MSEWAGETPESTPEETVTGGGRDGVCSHSKAGQSSREVRRKKQNKKISKYINHID